MLKFLAVLLCVGVSYAQIPQPCFSPPELSFYAAQYNHEMTTFRYFDAAYDVKGERIAFYEREDTGPAPGRQYFHIIFLHKENIMYEYNRQTKTCRKSQAGRFVPFAVPENAQFEAEYYIGGPGEDVEATEWSDRSETQREEWIGVFSRINCYPIRTWLRNTVTNETITTQIFDLVNGITDPSLFEPEPVCLNNTFVHEISPLANSLRSTYTMKFH